MINPLKPVRHFLWGVPSEDPAERKLVNKLDATILPFVCLAFLINYLDRANLANAYVTGMKEDAHFVGNDYTYCGTFFTAGYIIGQIPAALLLSSGRIPARMVFVAAMVCWGFVTLGTAFVTSAKQVWACRFLIGFFEATTFSGTHFILGSWYTDRELGKRSAVFVTSSQIGSTFSGVMQGAIVTTLGGKHGLAGWQWLFIIDFAVTIPVAFYGYMMFPDSPHTTKAFYLSADERKLAVARLPHTEHVKMTWTTLRSSLKRLVVDWRFWTFSALFTISATSFEKVGVYSEFPLWLKSTGKYTVAQVNYYPSIFTATAVLSTYFLTLISDHTRNRFMVNPIMWVASSLSAVLLLVWNIPTGAHWFAYIVGGLGYAGQASNFTWANEMTRDDDVIRALTLYGMNLFSNIWNLWYAIVCWPVVDAPRFKTGQIATIVTGAVSMGLAISIVYLGRRFPPDLPKQPSLEEATDAVYGGEEIPATGGSEKDLDPMNVMTTVKVV